MDWIICKRFCFVVSFCFIFSQLNAQDAGQFISLYRGPYTMVERSDWSRYDNGKYTGHVYREVRASVLPVEAGGELYRGNFLVLEETLRDMRQSARKADMLIPVSFTVQPDGEFSIAEDRGFPSYRGFPSFPAEKIRPGAKWTAPAVRAVDPLNEGLPLLVSIMVDYEYKGIEEYQGTPAHRVVAKYASRYPPIIPPAEQGPPNGDYSFDKLQGNHQLDILLRVSDCIPLLIRDYLDETFVLKNAVTLRFRGFTLIFFQGSVPLNREEIIAPVDERQFAVENVPEGIRLTVKNIGFMPDSADFLPSEQSRIDLIAQTLSRVSGRFFLVEGHTAAVSRPNEEMELSIQRAKRVIEELVRRGIPEEKFAYKGWGGTRPVADNSTEEGRSSNRRVEITILE
jgi:outer membrane protein OmpA-like peptidoglycan-associated protein